MQHWAFYTPVFFFQYHLVCEINLRRIVDEQVIEKQCRGGQCDVHTSSSID